MCLRVCGMRARGYYINKQSVNEQTETDRQYFRGRNNMVRPGAGEEIRIFGETCNLHNDF